MSQPVPQCVVCSAPTHSVCSQCTTTFYCSDECHIQDWFDGHHLVCCGAPIVLPSEPPTDVVAGSGEDSAWGVLVGHAIGDNLGSFLEFSLPLNDASSARDKQLLTYALGMPGGDASAPEGDVKRGHFAGIGYGQVTDDGELTNALARGIIEAGAQVVDSNNEMKKLFSHMPTARWFVAWRDSDPFDIGQATRNSMQGISESTKNPQEKMFENAATLNSLSKANGGLMRISSWAIFGSRLAATGDEKLLFQLGDMAARSAQLTHSNAEAAIAAGAYVVGLASIVAAHRNATPSGLNLAATALNATTLMSRYMNVWTPAQSRKLTYFAAAANAFFVEGLRAAGGAGGATPAYPPLPTAKQHEGFYAHAWRMVAFFLQKAANAQDRTAAAGADLIPPDGVATVRSDPTKFFADAMKYVLRQGGDTDTNGCIVGAMLGGLVGYKALPYDWSLKVDLSRPTRPSAAAAAASSAFPLPSVQAMFLRPEWMHAANLRLLATQLYALAPHNLVVDKNSARIKIPKMPKATK